MKNLFAISLAILSLSLVASAADKAETFQDPEANFKWAMQTLLDKHLDKKITAEQLYRAATAGMVQSLNAGEESWNKLLSPTDLAQMQSDLTGKVTGIGLVLKFDDATGHGQVLNTTAGSPSERAGLKTDDLILSVDGKTFKGKGLAAMVQAVRGDAGKSVALRVLRGDEVLRLSMKRQVINWTPVELEPLDSTTGLLTIGFFNDQTAQLVEAKLNEAAKKGWKNLVVDVRGNQGGSFEQAVKVAGYFVPKDQVLATTKNRQGETETLRSTKSLLPPDVNLVLLTNKDTFCGGELFVAALRENRKVRTIGETTFGKWNIQSVDPMPNRFALKYTVQEFRSPKGNTFQDVGIKPDLQVTLPAAADPRDLRAKFNLTKRLEVDTQLKAALDWIQSS